MGVVPCLSLIQDNGHQPAVEQESKYQWLFSRPNITNPCRICNPPRETFRYVPKSTRGASLLPSKGVADHSRCNHSPTHQTCETSSVHHEERGALERYSHLQPSLLEDLVNHESSSLETRSTCCPHAKIMVSIRRIKLITKHILILEHFLF